jgi:hypothetical protein
MPPYMGGFRDETLWCRRADVPSRERRLSGREPVPTTAATPA